MDRNYRGKTLTLAEILDALESENEVPDTIYLLPPTDGAITDEDSGEEECADPNRMNPNQLLAEAEVSCKENAVDVIEDWIHIPKIAQSWCRRRGNEENLNLSSFLYNFIPWKGALLPPLTLNSETHPLEFFELFMNENFIRVIKKYSNLYSSQRNQGIYVTEREIYVFLGIVILSGYVPLPRRNMYWEDRQDSHNAMVSNAMRRNRFNDIFVNIHVCDNNDIDNTDKMAKIRPMADHLNKMFVKFAPIEMQLSVDESLIPYFERNSCKQFMRLKPVRFGYKVWVAATRLGYCVQFEFYQGRNQKRDPTVFLGEFVVLSLAEVIKREYPGVTFSYFDDNFFTSPDLTNKLTKLKCGGTGTLRENRLKNISLTDKQTFNKKDRGSYESFVDKQNQLILTRWKDNQTVSMLSNVHGMHPIGAAQRFNSIQKANSGVPQPNVNKQYNKYMGGVDQLDNNVSNYRIATRGKNWYNPIIMWMKDVSVVNPWTLARSYGGKLDSLEFRRQVATALCTKYGCPPKGGGRHSKQKHLTKGFVWSLS